MYSLILAASAIAPVLSATVGGSSPVGNPISFPGLNDVVPVGAGFSVVWNPTLTTTHGDCKSVDILLLHGPDAAHLQTIATLATAYPNNGTYAWDPSTDLAPSQVGYGIELVCTESKDYQYSTPFGVKNDKYVAAKSSSASQSSSTIVSATSVPTDVKNSSAPVVWVTDVVSHFTTYCPEATSFAINNKTYTVTKPTTLTITDCPCTISHTTQAPATALPSNGTLLHPYGSNSTIVRPTLSASTTAAAISESLSTASSTLTVVPTISQETATVTTASTVETAAASPSSAASGAATGMSSVVLALLAAVFGL